MFIDWRPNGRDTSEWFHFGRNRWRVDEAKKILAAKPRRSHSLSVADWRGVANFLEPRTAGTVSLEVPIICVRFSRGYALLKPFRRPRRGA
jgi:hypothetical protein